MFTAIRRFTMRILQTQRKANGAQTPNGVASAEGQGSPNFIVCRETGVHKPTLTRHIRQTLGMTPEEYRRKWRLDPSTPLVSRTYLAQRAAARNAIGAE
ncbi:MucR family transcriptional regulator [Oceanicola sp. 22II-s10i]|uniref:MucR family transcriptional regulator n=1 Tax=Oceanicola sp. 22II-s10i TaxID=1317116 RepID=UPI000B5246F9